MKDDKETEMTAPENGAEHACEAAAAGSDDAAAAGGGKNKKSGAVRAISTVMLITLAGKLLGLLRDRLLAVNYGTGMYANAFLTASRIPRVFFDMLFASAIAASFIPVFNEVLKKRGKDDAVRLGGNFITLVGAATLILTVAGMIFSGPLVELFAAGYDAPTTELCVSLTRLMFPTIFFTGIAYAFVGILQSFDEFNIPAFISVLSNMIIIAYYYTFNSRFGIYGLSVAFLIGWSMQAVIQIPSLRRKGFRYRPSLDIKNNDIRKILAMMLPVMVSTWVQPINLAINTRFASHLNGGSGVSAIEYSTNLYLIIIGVFILSVTNVIFPKLSRQRVSDDEGGFDDTVRVTMHASMYFVIPMMLGVMCLSKALIDLIYGGGEFNSSDIDVTSQALFFVSIGMIGYAVQNILNKVYFAKMDGKTPLAAGIVSIIINVGLCYALIGRFGVAGLAVSSSVSATANAFVLAAVLEKKKEGYHTKAYMLDMLKITAASLVMAACVVLCVHLCSGLAGGAVGKLIVLVVPTAAGMLVYFALTAFMGLSEARMVLDKIGIGRKEES